MTAVYSPEAMVELMITQPQFTPAELALHFGHSRSWFSSVLASENFQTVLDSRRHEIINPAYTATLRERFTALALSTSDLLLERLDREGEDAVPDFTLLKTFEMAAKALGMGLKAAPAEAAPKTVEQLTSDALADRLVNDFAKRQADRTIDAMVQVTPVADSI